MPLPIPLSQRGNANRVGRERNNGQRNPKTKSRWEGVRGAFDPCALCAQGSLDVLSTVRTFPIIIKPFEYTWLAEEMFARRGSNSLALLCLLQEIVQTDRAQLLGIFVAKRFDRHMSGNSVFVFHANSDVPEKRL